MGKKSRILIIPCILCVCLIFSSCSKLPFLSSRNEDKGNDKNGLFGLFSGKTPKPEELLNKEGATIEERFKVPAGFQRVEAAEGSFAQFLRSQKLKPDGTKVKYYDGKVKAANVYDAVLDVDVGDRDLQQCADAVMRLRAEYLYKMGQYDKIKFHFVSGFLADYTTWMNGSRIKVDGNNASWVKKTGYSNEYSSFRQYMDMVFAYAGTVSLEKELKSVTVKDMKIGDVFIKGSLPGHIIIIVDMAENKTTGEKLFMVAQSSTPAQDIHILKSSENKNISPWYSINFGDELTTPEWDFTSNQLMGFVD